MSIKRIAALLTAGCLLFGPLQAFGAPETGAASYWVMETGTGRVLAEKQPQAPLPAASLTKLMTCLLTLEAIDRGELAWDEALTLPPAYTNPGGSTMALRAGETVTVRQLAEGLMIVSANDAAELLARRIAGSEAAFVAAMNQRALQLGLTRARFLNPTGLPTEAGQNVMTAEEVGRLSAYLIRQYGEDLLSITRKPRLTDSRRNLVFRGTNTLMLEKPAVDGLKTGHTNAAGYCLSATMPFRGRHDSRLVAVVMGTADEGQRDASARALLEWSEQHYAYRAVISASERISGGVWKGLKDRPVTLRPEKTVERLLARDEAVSLTYDPALPEALPLHKGDPAGTVTAVLPGGERVTVALVSETEITRLTLRERLTLAIRALRSWLGSRLSA